MKISQNYHLDYDRAVASQSKRKFINKPRQAEELLIKQIIEYTKNSDKNSLKILDLGCGDGRLLKLLATVLPENEYYGWDPAHSLITKNTTLHPHINWMCFNSLDDQSQVISYNNSFDIIIAVATTQVLSSAISSLQPLESIELFLRLVQNLLINGGIFLNFDGYHEFSEYDLISYSYKVNEDIKKSANQCLLDSQIYSYPSRSWLVKTLQDLGFNDIEVNPFYLKGIEIQHNSIPGETFTVRKDKDLYYSRLGLIDQPWAHVRAVLLGN